MKVAEKVSETGLLLRIYKTVIREDVINSEWQLKSYIPKHRCEFSPLLWILRHFLLSMQSFEMPPVMGETLISLAWAFKYDQLVKASKPFLQCLRRSVGYTSSFIPTISSNIALCSQPYFLHDLCVSLLMYEPFSPYCRALITNVFQNLLCTCGIMTASVV
jgi:hypothetical protein